ncbi:MAG: ATP-binding cassette domain-containing protein [Desulfobacteraceae bacterium]
MRDKLKAWLKYFVFISLFGMCINIIYLIVPIYVMVVYDRVLFSYSKETLITLSAIALFSLTVMGILEYFRSRMLVQAGRDMEEKMSGHVMTAMHKDALSGNRAGYTRGLQDLALFCDGIKNYRLMRMLELPWVLVYLALLYFMHPLLGMVALGGVGMTAVFGMLLKSVNKKRYAMADTGFWAATAFFAKTLRNADLVTGMGMLSDVEAKYARTHDAVKKIGTEADINRCGISALTSTLQAISTAALFGAGAYLFFDDQISVGVMFAGVLVVLRLFSFLQAGVDSLKSSVEALAAYKRLSHFVDTEEKSTTFSLPEPDGRLQAEGVTFGVKGLTILRNISFMVEPGETLGVFGPSTSGKSALARLLLGIWQPLAGKVRIGGAEVGQWQRGELGRHVGYLPQETDLFPGTVGENIARLKTPDPDKVIAACKKAHCHEMVLKLPRGYDFVIDSTGKNISGGQKEQIALARALYNDPGIVVLDEPHLHLDDVGFKSLLAALQVLKKEKKTVVVVTDRPNLLVQTDKLLMLKEGQVAMFGPSREVLAKLSGQQQTAPQQSQQRSGQKIIRSGQPPQNVNPTSQPVNKE